ncbi:MAG: type II secretion system GspH family protein [Lachnospiraceae bacterium]|nr:type II secretion system GspH family protein [Lachnospiraceae bacterium]
MKKNNKGFTLVELIVVLVILAILAAALVPSLLCYIDRARESKYFEEGHAIYTALQVLEDEQYAKGSEPITALAATNTAELKEVNAMVDPSELQTATITMKDATAHGKYTIDKLVVKFKSQDGNVVTLTMEDGTWTQNTATE